MPERKRRLRILLMNAVLLPSLLYVLYFFTLGPKPWAGVDAAVVEKIAREHGGILLKDKTTAFPTDEGEPVAKNMDRRRDELVIRQGLQRNPTSPGGAEDIDYSAVRGLV